MADIEDAETALGVDFPPELRDWYSLADGSDVDIPSVFEDGHWFLPLAESVSHYRLMSEFHAGKPVDDFAFWRSQIRRPRGRVSDDSPGTWAC